MHFEKNIPFLQTSGFRFLPQDLISRSIRRKTQGGGGGGGGGGMNFLYWPKVHINEGLRFPLPPWCTNFLFYPSLSYPYSCEHYTCFVRGMHIKPQV